MFWERENNTVIKCGLMKRARTLILIMAGLLPGIILNGQNGRSNKYVEVYRQYLNARCPIPEDSIKHFVYFARDREAIHNHPFLKIERFAGAQIMYPWRILEPERGIYDFSAIEEDYEYLLSMGKRLFIQLQDVTFNPEIKAIPGYLIAEEFAGGALPQYNDEGVIEGWVAKRWNPQVQQRFALLLDTLGKVYDGKIEGINLQETSIGIDSGSDTSYSPGKYAESVKINMASLKRAFPHSTTMQYANFMPGEWLPGDDRGYLRSIYDYGEEIGVGLGGPDLMVHRKPNLNHTVAMMHERGYTVPLGIAIQDGNYTGTTGDGNITGDPIGDGTGEDENIVPLLHAFAEDFLKVSYMFWACQEPYFSEYVIPCFLPSESPD